MSVISQDGRRWRRRVKGVSIAVVGGAAVIGTAVAVNGPRASGPVSVHDAAATAGTGQVVHFQIADDGYTGDETIFNRVTTYMAQQMVQNAASSNVATMRTQLASGNPALIAAANASFALLVCPNCSWDHKPKLVAMFDLPVGAALFTDVPSANRRLFYDVWSNIHYGYVGMAAGFSESTLQSTQKHVDGESLADDRSVAIGIDLYNRYKLAPFAADSTTILTRAVIDEVNRAGTPWDARPRLTASQTVLGAVALGDGVLRSRPGTGPGSAVKGTYKAGDVGVVHCSIASPAQADNQTTTWFSVTLNRGIGYVPYEAVTFTQDSNAADWATLPTCP